MALSQPIELNGELGRTPASFMVQLKSKLWSQELKYVSYTDVDVINSSAARRSITLACHYLPHFQYLFKFTMAWLPNAWYSFSCRISTASKFVSLLLLLVHSSFSWFSSSESKHKQRSWVLDKSEHAELTSLCKQGIHLSSMARDPSLTSCP